jgi:hypothetical protein
MRIWANILLAFTAFSALVLAWGYWYSLNHASINLRVDDYALKSQNQVYGAPHDVTLTLRDSAKVQLAVARSVEPLGYILAVHPSPNIGNCEHRATPPGSQGDYAECYKQYAAWLATWAPRVHSADVRVGSCELREVPVTAHVSNDEWLVWWVPLPHIGGLPRRYFDLSVAIDGRACAAAIGQFGVDGNSPPHERGSGRRLRPDAGATPLAFPQTPRPGGIRAALGFSADQAPRVEEAISRTARTAAATSCSANRFVARSIPKVTMARDFPFRTSAAGSGRGSPLHSFADVFSERRAV